MDRRLERLLIQDLIVYPFIGMIDGDATYGEAIILKAYYEPLVQLVKDSSGRDVVSQGFIILKGTDFDSIHITDKIQMNVVGAKNIISIGPFQNPRGFGWDHVEVYV